MCDHRMRPGIPPRVALLIPHVDAWKAGIAAVRVDVERGDRSTAHDGARSHASHHPAATTIHSCHEHPRKSSARSGSPSAHCTGAACLHPAQYSPRRADSGRLRTSGTGTAGSLDTGAPERALGEERGGAAALVLGDGLAEQ